MTELEQQMCIYKVENCITCRRYDISNFKDEDEVEDFTYNNDGYYHEYMSWDEFKENAFALSYNGEIIGHYTSWEQVEDEFEDELVDQLKKCGYFREEEYGESSYDDVAHEFKVIKLTFID